MDSSLLYSSVHGILQTGILEWVVVFSPGDLPDTGVKPRSPVLQADSLPSEPPGKPYICYTCKYIVNILKIRISTYPHLINKDVISILTWGAFTIMHATLFNL